MKAKRKHKLAVHFSSATDDWATPQALFDEMNAKYGPFELDAAASHENAKVSVYCTPEGTFRVYPSDRFQRFGSDGLSTNWHAYKRVWLNPPYGREIGKWVKKAYEEASKGCMVVALLPARVDTKYFHDYIYSPDPNGPTVSYSFIKGRLKFGNAKNAAPFPSMIVVFYPPEKKP